MNEIDEEHILLIILYFYFCYNYKIIKKRERKVLTCNEICKHPSAKVLRTIEVAFLIRCVIIELIRILSTSQSVLV